MRTTLKRGIGRAAGAPNGNGRAVLPPAAHSPISLYRQPEPPRRSGWRLLGKILIWLVVAALMVVAGMAGGAYLYVHEKVAEVQPTSPETRIAARQLQVELPGQPATALVIGYDKRQGPEKDLPALSDTIMLLRADPETEAVSMLSFPRDLLVEIKCPGPKADYVGRINSAYSECRGPIGTLQTVRALTKLPINYLITVNFRGFRQIVHELGGVWLDVDRRYFNDNAGRFDTYAPIDLKPGYQRLSGGDVLDFVRYRHTDDDFHRIARQQLFVKSFKAQVSSSFSPLKLPSLINAITSNVEIARGGGKEVDLGVIKSYALLLYSLPAGHFFQSTIEGLEQDAEFNLIPSQAGIDAALAEFAAPDVDAPEKAAAVSLGRRLPRSGPRPQDVTISVLNGNGRSGSAGNAAFELAKHRYTIVTGDEANAPSWDYFHTKVYFDAEQSGARKAAAKVKTLFGVADVERLPLELERLSNGAMLTVVVGETFGDRLAAAPVDRTPKKQPPAVAENPDATRELLRAVRGRVPFRLMLPRLIERSSNIDREMPIRVYRIAKDHLGVRLTFRYGDQNAYWGIEQTDWEDAPILRSPNVTQVIKGRKYELHYNGARLHMVVLRANGSTYWVVNTLLDVLSNDTMLAIAKGLRPLGQ